MRTLMLALAAMALAASPALAADARQQERDKKTVVDFYEKALNQKDFDAAAKYLGPRYTQHNPNATDGPEGRNIPRLAERDQARVRRRRLRDPARPRRARAPDARQRHRGHL
jgi:hypothetical protein